jgi:hypothetical protein
MRKLTVLIIVLAVTALVFYFIPREKPVPPPHVQLRVSAARWLENLDTIDFTISHRAGDTIDIGDIEVRVSFENVFGTLICYLDTVNFPSIYFSPGDELVAWLYFPFVPPSDNICVTIIHKPTGKVLMSEWVPLEFVRIGVV